MNYFLGLGHVGILRAAFALSLMAACSSATTDDEQSDGFEQFKSKVYREPESGLYIVNGDTPIETEENLKRFYFDHVYHPKSPVSVIDQSLTVNRIGTSDDKWSDTAKRWISYCVSNSFGSNYGAVRDAMLTATADWGNVANIQFAYISDQDASCNAANNNVVFDVSPTSGQSYHARSFFPSYSRSNRNIMINSSAFGSISPLTLAGILRHEAGHILGFRHEQTRPEAGTCFEDNNWRLLTSYDSNSVMHYPWCNGTNNGDIVLTQRDKDGARILYGHQTSSTILGDINGDGRADGVAINDGDIWTVLSSGSGFGTPSRWLNGGFYGNY